MILFATHFAKHATIRIEELGFLLGAVAGVVLLLSAMTPLGKRAGQALAGLALAAGSVILIVALHWGSL
jgi:hypothetical protein